MSSLPHLLMHGLRSGRTQASSAPTAQTTHLPGTEIQPHASTHTRTPPPETHSLPVIQSPYFHGSSAADHTTVGGGGLDDLEDFNFDAGYVISSKLSEMVANGAFSYPPPNSNSVNHPPSHLPHDSHPTRPHNSHPLQNRIKTEPGMSYERPPPTQYGIKTEPGMEINLFPTVTIKREPGIEPLQQFPTVTIKQEPGLATTLDQSGIHTAARVQREPGLATTLDQSGSHTAARVKREPGLATTLDQSGIHTAARVKREPGLATTLDQSGIHTAVRVKREPEDAVKTEKEDGWEPPLWRVQYQNICQMRSERTAPVDTHGCFMLAQKDVPPHVRRYQVLVSLMLSSQTKDQITGKAMTNLKKHGLTIDNILTTPREDIAKMINVVGFWHKKSDYIKRTTDMLASKYNGDIPNTLKDLMSLPGVGPKMANLVMDFAWGQVTGIAVDTHVHRISHRLGWMTKQTPTPEATRISLEKWLPMSEWSNLNLMMVGFGQTICSPQRPHCGDCLNRNICPSSLACNDATMGGLVGHFSPGALTTGKKKKKSKGATAIKGESLDATPTDEVIGEPSTPNKKKRKLNKTSDM